MSLDQLTPEDRKNIAEAIASGKKIEAIKIYRNATGQGLKESKDFIDALIEKLVAEDPVKYADAKGKIGCAVTAAACCVALTIAAGILLSAL
ncbi:MAG TPA: ribosomal protein L7/L12 [Candidatus Brocadiia bacterium]|nr:ribosomal protein L7/L12 [Candidatus Brocadiia bacterium]